jgi:hypothetical protein
MVIKVFAYLSGALIINWIAFLLKSDFITTFPGSDFITMVVMILAINTATSSYIISKLEDLARKDNINFDFTDTYKEIKKSIIEQVIIFIVSFVVLIIRSSKIINPQPPADQFNYLSFGVDVLLTLLLLLIIDILWDTGKSIFILTSKFGKKDK